MIYLMKFVAFIVSLIVVILGWTVVAVASLLGLVLTLCTGLVEGDWREEVWLVDFPQEARKLWGLSVNCLTSIFE